MANNFTLTLDTTGPAAPSVSINAGAAYTTSQSVTLTIGTSDTPVTGYQMKVWGDIDGGPATEGAATWIAYATSHPVTLSTGDGNKTINVRIRDDVYNESSQASDTITLDTTLPVVNVSVGPDVTKVSKIAGKRTASFSFQVDSVFDEYKVKVVPATNSLHTAGTTIATTNGSTNMAATGTFAANTNINSTIDGRDLEVASAGDGAKIVKVFAKEASSQAWSV